METYSGLREKVLVTVVYEGSGREGEMWYVLKFVSEAERWGWKTFLLLGDFAGLGVRGGVFHAHVPDPLYLHVN